MKDRFYSNFEQPKKLHQTNFENNYAQLNDVLPDGYKEIRHTNASRQLSLSDILKLSKNEKLTVINFFNLIERNLDLMTNEDIELTLKKIERLVNILDNSPSSIIDLYSDKKMRNDDFYYEVITDLYKIILLYFQYLGLNGYENLVLHKQNFLDINDFNSILNEIKKKCKDWLMKLAGLEPDRFPIVRPVKVKNLVSSDSGRTLVVINQEEFLKMKKDNSFLTNVIYVLSDPGIVNIKNNILTVNGEDVIIDNIKGLDTIVTENNLLLNEYKSINKEIENDYKKLIFEVEELKKLINNK